VEPVETATSPLRAWDMLTSAQLAELIWKILIVELFVELETPPP
jgi:hypothetical protein